MAEDETPHQRARAERQRRLEEFTIMVDACECLWPLQTYRNGSGHHPTCPAYLPIGTRAATTTSGG